MFNRSDHLFLLAFILHVFKIKFLSSDLLNKEA